MSIVDRVAKSDAPESRIKARRKESSAGSDTCMSPLQYYIERVCDANVPSKTSADAVAPSL